MSAYGAKRTFDGAIVQSRRGRERSNRLATYGRQSQPWLRAISSSSEHFLCERTWSACLLTEKLHANPEPSLIAEAICLSLRSADMTMINLWPWQLWSWCRRFAKAGARGKHLSREER